MSAPRLAERGAVFVADVTRRTLLAASASLAIGAASRLSSAPTSSRFDTIVVGAGVFGSWTADRLRAWGQNVLLLDAWGPAHARASSGGESRMTRSGYGADEVYTRMAWASLPQWKALSASAGLPIFHPIGVLTLFQEEVNYALQSVAVHKRLGLSMERLEPAELRRRYPQIETSDIRFGLLEPEFGALMARRSVQTLVERFVRAGGHFAKGHVLPPEPGKPLDGVRTRGGEVYRADRFVFACGPWLPKLFPAHLASRIFPTRQEIFFFSPPGGDRRFDAGALPGWADFNGGDFYYGFPDLEARGFKIAYDGHGAPIDPDSGDRTASAEGLARVRTYMDRRFPALKGAQLVETRVCQYENSANGDFLIDRHPDWANAVLVGGGSGHGFKHGPEVGRYAAELSLGRLAAVEPRFSLATKATRQERAVH